jgi:hypothetical protein
LKTRLLLKTLWLIPFLFLSIFFSMQLSQLAATISSLLNSARGSDVRQLITTARDRRYSLDGTIDIRVELLFSSLWELFTELGTN